MLSQLRMQIGLYSIAADCSCDLFEMHESKTLRKTGRGFVVRDLPWTEEKLRAIPPFEFENWAVIALGGIKNKVQVGDMGIDGRIFPVGSEPKGFGADELGLQERWYPIQVKQKDKAGRPDIDQFETAMRLRLLGRRPARNPALLRRGARHHRPPHGSGDTGGADWDEAGVKNPDAFPRTYDW
jgi:hypothetical protein